MALTFDTANLIIESTASITDLPAFHAALRDWEDNAEGAIWPVTHTWKALDLGGAFFYQADLINGWTLKFPVPGNYTISGNLNATIVPVAGVYVERKTSAAYVTTAIGGSGPSAADIAAAVLAAAQVTPIKAEVPEATLGLKLSRNKLVTDPVTGIVTLYDDDDTTPLLSGDLYEDASGTQPYRGKGAERRERMT